MNPKYFKTEVGVAEGGRKGEREETETPGY